VRWTILRTCIEERLVYRADFAFSTLVRFLPLVTYVLLWGAIFRSTPEQSLNGYRYEDMVAYGLLAMLTRAFSSMPGLADTIGRDIRDGTIKKFLTQPVDMLGYLFWHRVAHKVVYYAVAAGPFALVFYLCRHYFSGWPDAVTIAAWLLSLAMAFLIGFLLEALIGLLGFWILEVGPLIFVHMMLNYFLSGHMIPLDFLGKIGEWIGYLPFKYLVYFPATVIMGRYTHAELAWELAIEAVWLAGMFIALRLAFARGVRRYGAFGG
jgi:ABC-2 type transport system permease protein